MLLGDNAYPASDSLITMYKVEGPMLADARRRRKRYNKILAKTRVVSEQAFGTWKQRFPIVLGIVRNNLKQVPRIIQCTLALHNFVVMTGGGYIQEPDVPLEDDEPI